VGRVTTYTGRVSEVLDFLVELDSRSIAYTLARPRRTALLVSVVVPGQRWEVEFTDEGGIEVEVFTSGGTVLGGTGLADLWRLTSEQ